VSVPSAGVTHPWWDGGRRGYLHFFRWATGDGHLFQLYPPLMYWSFPNVAESVLLALAFAVLVLVLQAVRAREPPAAWALLLFPLSVLEGEMALDVLKHTVTDPTRLPSLRGVRRVLAAAESSVVILALETGRLWGHAGRGTVCSSIFRRCVQHP
jgi:hypothetical protein